MRFIYEEKPWLAYYTANVPADIELVENKSVGEAFDESVEQYKKKTAMIYYGAKITYQKLKDQVDRLANALSDLGVKKGDRVGLLLLNSPEFLYSYFAAAKVGAVLTQISPVYVSLEIRHQLEDSGAEHLICQDILYAGVEKTGVTFKNVILTNVADSLPWAKRAMSKGILRGVYQKMASPAPEIYEGKGMYRMKALLETYQPDPPQVKIDTKVDLLVLPYTGGTTGAPKGVMITHFNTMNNFEQQVKFWSDRMKFGEETIIGFMPFYHQAGCCQAVNMMLMGGTLVIITSPDLDEILLSVVKYKATQFVGAPSLFEMLKDYKKTSRVNWRNLKMLSCGADTLHEETSRDWEERTGTILTNTYGMTETTAVTHTNPEGNERHGSIGIPISSTMAAILDPEEDRYVPAGEIGELVVNGPQITVGYWQNPDATAECEAVINGIRWWRTGDLASMTEDGYFSIYDRKRDLIKYKGLRVYAREVEEVLKEHSQIKEVGVVGERDKLVGENVKAVIVLESDARGKVSEKDIREYCEEKLAHYKIPRIVEFVGEIPKTDIGKVSRREIRKQEED